jgi:molybdopterin converting factor subunit 1
VRVTVLLFAGLRDVAGAAEVPLSLHDGSTVADAWRALAATHPGIVPYAAAVSCARNAEYARMADAIADGDEIAFLPPVSGGSPHL